MCFLSGRPENLNVVNTQRSSALDVVEARLTLQQYDDVAGLATHPLDVTLSYDPADPFAVTATLHGEPGPVRWSFARELLADGMFEPAGDGDVHVWPCVDAWGTAVVMLELSSPDGQFLGHMTTREVAPFVRRMLAVVPLGSEADHLDLDALVELLVGPAAG